MKASIEQQVTLCDYLEKNPYLASGDYHNAAQRHRAKVLWDRIAKTLNAMRGGGKRDGMGWAKFWADKKSYMKKLTLRNGAVTNETSPQPNSLHTRMLKIVKEVSGLQRRSKSWHSKYKTDNAQFEENVYTEQSKPTVEQQEALCEFLEHHSILVGRCQTSSKRQLARALWQKAAKKLNALPGAKRDGPGWAKYFIDKKSYMRKVARTEIGVEIDALHKRFLKLISAGDLPTRIKYSPDDEYGSAINSRATRTSHQGELKSAVKYYPSRQQQEALCEMMEKSNLLASSDSHTQEERERARAQWYRVADVLNEMEGARKDGPGWASFWFDKKFYITKKLRSEDTNPHSSESPAQLRAAVQKKYLEIIGAASQPPDGQSDCVNITLSSSSEAKPSEAQQDALCDFLEENMCLVRRSQHAITRRRLWQLWDQVADKLNALGGAVRDGPGWSKYWIDKKSYLKRLAFRNASEFDADLLLLDEDCPQLNRVQKRFLKLVAMGDPVQQRRSYMNLLDDRVAHSRVTAHYTLDDRSAKPSYRQQKAMCEFLEQNRFLVNGRKSKKFASAARKLWNRLAEILNEMKGAKRDGPGWAKYWIDKKSYMRRLALQNGTVTDDVLVVDHTCPQLIGIHRRFLKLIAEGDPVPRVSGADQRRSDQRRVNTDTHHFLEVQMEKEDDINHSDEEDTIMDRLQDKTTGPDDMEESQTNDTDADAEDSHPLSDLNFDSAIKTEVSHVHKNRLERGKLSADTDEEYDDDDDNPIIYMAQGLEEMKPTYAQQETLCDFLSENLFLAKGRYHTTESRQNSKVLWAKIAETLNAMGGGYKDGPGWAKYWIDKKAYLKRLALRSGTVVDEDSPRLTGLDGRFLSLICDGDRMPLSSNTDYSQFNDTDADNDDASANPFHEVQVDKLESKVEIDADAGPNQVSWSDIPGFFLPEESSCPTKRSRSATPSPSEASYQSEPRPKRRRKQRKSMELSVYEKRRLLLEKKKLAVAERRLALERERFRMEKESFATQQGREKKRWDSIANLLRDLVQKLSDRNGT